MFLDLFSSPWFMASTIDSATDSETQTKIGIASRTLQLLHEIKGVVVPKVKTADSYLA